MTCSVPDCALVVGGEGEDSEFGVRMRRPACLPGGSAWVVLCWSHALATAPDDHVAETAAGMNASPPVKKSGEQVRPSGYQVEGATFLAQRWAACLTDDKGIGKTLQAALATPPGAPVIICCPKSVRHKWSEEFRWVHPGYNVFQLRGRGAWRGGPPPGTALVLNFEILPIRSEVCKCGHDEPTHPIGRDEETPELALVPLDHPAGSCLECNALAKRAGKKHGACPSYRRRDLTGEEVAERLGIQPGTVLIADEAHRVARASQQTRNFRELRSACTRVWTLTASPIKNRPLELWDLYQTTGVAQGAFRSKKHFDKLYVDFDRDQRVPGKSHLAEIEERRSWVELGRSAAQVKLELPPCRFEQVDVTLTAKDLKELERLLGEAMAVKRAHDAVAEGRLEDPRSSDEAAAAFADAVQSLVFTSYADADLIAAVREVVSNPTGVMNTCLGTVRKHLALAKISAVTSYVEEAEEAEEPVVLFSVHRGPIEHFGDREGWGEISGRVTGARRERAKEAFQAGDLRGISCTIQAAGEAIDLYRSHLCGFIDLAWTPEDNDQALKRLLRRGQTSSVLASTFGVNHPAENRVLEVLGIKKALIDACRPPSGGAS